MRFNALLAILFCFSLSAYSQDCGNSFDLKKLKKENPQAYDEFLRIEKLTEAYRIKMASNPNARLIDENGVITIPVVFHILHRGEAIGTGTNLAQARLEGQIAELSRCYLRTNNQVGIPQVFLNVAGNTNFRFILACRDPNGNVTNGIIRKQTSTPNFTSTSDNAKSNSQGGDDAWPTDRYLNVWITPNLSSSTTTLFGYTQDPNMFSQAPNKDDVVVVFDAVGVDPANNPVRNTGHTLVHEIGHWVNLIHPYDSGCGGDDFCNDTPQQAQRTDNQVACASIIFPRNANVCTNTPNGDMYENFMDNTNENCGRRMFTVNQVTRMRAMFQVGGPRRGFIDNYFKLVFSGYRTCIEEFDFVSSPFCEAAGNITWGITGPATFSNPSGFSVYVNPTNGSDGEAVLTASWNNLTSSLTVPVGWGAENFTYTVTNGGASTALISGNFHPAGSNTSGTILFTGATGAGTNWRIVNQYGSVSFSGYLNSFSLNLGQGASVTVAVDIPTLCGTRTATYIFARSNYQFALSPNPASNSLRVQGTSQDATIARNGFSYDVEILSGLGQMVKNVKNVSSGQDKDIDISALRANEFYTIRFISNNEVVVQKFFKS